MCELEIFYIYFFICETTNSGTWGHGQSPYYNINFIRNKAFNILQRNTVIKLQQSSFIFTCWTLCWACWRFFTQINLKCVFSCIHYPYQNSYALSTCQIHVRMTLKITIAPFRGVGGGISTLVMMFTGPVQPWNACELHLLLTLSNLRKNRKENSNSPQTLKATRFIKNIENNM